MSFQPDKKHGLTVVTSKNSQKLENTYDILVKRDYLKGVLNKQKPR